jgi:hypothetical protein
VNELISTTADIVKTAQVLRPADRFFSRFESAFESVKHRILKLETRQTYREPGNPSWEALNAGNFGLALELLPSARAEDVDLYRSLSGRGVSFIRVRPVAFPLTNYLRWEIHSYIFNAAHGEQIYFVEYEKHRQLFEQHLRHDFMLFDSALALIHDYNSEGLIRGGWETTSQAAITSLATRYEQLFADAEPFSEFLARRGIQTETE